MRKRLLWSKVKHAVNKLICVYKRVAQLVGRTGESRYLLEDNLVLVFIRLLTIWKLESNVSVATACPSDPVILENAPAVPPVEKK